MDLRNDPMNELNVPMQYCYLIIFNYLKNLNININI